MHVATTQGTTALPLAIPSVQATGADATGSASAPVAKDRVRLSGEALASSAKGAAATDPTLKLLGDLLSTVTGAGVQSLQYQEASLSTTSASLSFSGNISTRDGKNVGFDLELQYDHASFAEQSVALQSGADGISLSYEGTAAEVTTKSFSFTLASTASGAAVPGKGVLHLNDEVSSIAKEMKPLVKEFLRATGEQGGWGEVNRLLRSTV